MIIPLMLALNLFASVQETTGAVCNAMTLHSSVVAQTSAGRPVDAVVRAPDTLKLVGIKRFDLPCAEMLQASLMDQVRLADGRVFERSGAKQSYAARLDEGIWHDGYAKRTTVEKSHPLMQGKGPIWTDGVTCPGGYVGVWKIGGQWMVASFSLKQDGSFTKPQAILASSRPLRSASYFPAPDTNTGRLEIVQAQDDGSVWALAFDWDHGALHSNWYPKAPTPPIVGDKLDSTCSTDPDRLDPALCHRNLAAPAPVGQSRHPQTDALVSISRQLRAQ